MLAVDWLGCSLTAGVLGLFLRGRLRVPRVILAMVLGELGRLLLVVLLGGKLLSATVGGAFTRLTLEGLPYILVQVGGLLAGALLGLLFGKRVAQDTLLYAALAGGTIVLLLS